VRPRPSRDHDDRPDRVRRISFLRGCRKLVRAYRRAVAGGFAAEPMPSFAGGARWQVLVVCGLAYLFYGLNFWRNAACNCCKKVRSGFELRENRCFAPRRSLPPRRIVKESRGVRGDVPASGGTAGKFWGEGGERAGVVSPGLGCSETGPDGRVGREVGLWGAKLNLSHNCVDRHALGDARREKGALLWEGEPG